MEYAEEFWDPERYGRFPDDYDRLYAAWNEHGLWGSVEARWELQSFEVDLPAAAPAR